MRTIRCSISLPLLFLFTACTSHYTGRVVDVHGRPVPYARVEGSGMHHAFPMGENIFTVSTLADADGKFTLVSSDWPGEIKATSPDSKRHGRFDLTVSTPPIVIVVR